MKSSSSRSSLNGTHEALSSDHYLNSGHDYCVSEMQFERNTLVLNHPTFAKDNHKSDNFSTVDKQLNPRTPANSHVFEHVQPTMHASIVPRLDLENHRSPGVSLSAASTFRACRTRCPGGPRLVYTEDTHRTGAGNLSSRSLNSNSTNAVCPEPTILMNYVSGIRIL
jgi:hypothetical protein